ncbi:MAG TPA: glutaredoxin family protein [Synechococcus sp. UBA8638]|uniref:glutaredoxin family protein n=1 Tax=Candidatus Synechococcus spongiarum TaxID=431041 RepID=UPI0004726548|nr:glutaredoxin family protein [Candidatus Synechococcus spongiarum]HBP53784.1 glutaredoxin family protein [Synechococcus sp. UBA8638]
MNHSTWPPLILLTRSGCCLCSGLAERLGSLLPQESLRLVDVDNDPALQRRFGLLVPLLVAGADPLRDPVLPRVPPRLKGLALQRWLEKHLGPFTGSAPG